MRQSIELRLPEKISTNKIYAGIHWGTRKKHKDLYRESFLEFRNKYIIPTPAIITYNFKFKSRPLDASNCSYMAKLLEDAMVKNGFLPDDSHKYVSGILITSQKGDTDSVIISWNQ